MASSRVVLSIPCDETSRSHYPDFFSSVTGRAGTNENAGAGLRHQSLCFFDGVDIDVLHNIASLDIVFDVQLQFIMG